MRVAMYYNNRDVRVEEMPVPNIGPGELLVIPLLIFDPFVVRR